MSLIFIALFLTSFLLSAEQFKTSFFLTNSILKIISLTILAFFKTKTHFLCRLVDQALLYWGISAISSEEISQVSNVTEV